MYNERVMILYTNILIILIMKTLIEFERITFHTYNNKPYNQ